MPQYLTDSSIWIGARKWPRSYLPDLLAERLAADEIAVCAPVALEVLVGASDGAELERDWENLWRHLHRFPVGERAMERTLELLRRLAHSTEGAHRRRPIDYIVAACAEAAGEDVVLWHWDRDLTAICEFAGIRHEAEHERATGHGINVEPGERRPGRRPGS